MEAIVAGEFCDIFSAGQMGKSNLRIRTMDRLQRLGFRCVGIDLALLGSQQITLEQWYGAIAASLVKGLQLPIESHRWWRRYAFLSPVARLAVLIETLLLPAIQQPIVILIDEIETVQGLSFPTTDLFALIQDCYQRRSHDPAYCRLNFAVFGVAMPQNLPVAPEVNLFNTGRSVTLSDFTGHQVGKLADGLRPWVPDPSKVLHRILYWTGGQPFLTQKLCQFVVAAAWDEPRGQFVPSDRWLDCLVQRRIIDGWEWQDTPAHLQTIRDRFWGLGSDTYPLLDLYGQVLRSESPGFPPVLVDHSDLQAWLFLTGVVITQNGVLRVKNPIYRQVFNLRWVRSQLNHTENSDPHRRPEFVVTADG
jgi:hypothetical protein